MIEVFNNFLNSYDYGKLGIVNDAVKYGIVDSGKRVRPMLLLSLLKDYGVDINLGLASALAVEMIHSYSLIHDDLPAMDDDDYRRNKLTVHKKFGEDMAILAGDALLTMAFFAIANDNLLEADKKVDLIKLLSDNAGINGMIYGQQLDLTFEDKDFDVKDIQEINIYKTAKLINYSLVASAIIANKKSDIKLLQHLANDLGLAFQIQDDIFDVTKSFEDIGKKPSDEDNNKATYVKLYGLEKSEVILKELFDNCFNIIELLNLKENNLKELVIKIQNRSY